MTRTLLQKIPKYPECSADILRTGVLHYLWVRNGVVFSDCLNAIWIIMSRANLSIMTFSPNFMENKTNIRNVTPLKNVLKWPKILWGKNEFEDLVWSPPPRSTILKYKKTCDCIGLLLYLQKYCLFKELHSHIVVLKGTAFVPPTISRHGWLQQRQCLFHAT